MCETATIWARGVLVAPAIDAGPADREAAELPERVSGFGIAECSTRVLGELEAEDDDG